MSYQPTGFPAFWRSSQTFSGWKYSRIAVASSPFSPVKPSIVSCHDLLAPASSTFASFAPASLLP